MKWRSVHLGRTVAARRGSATLPLGVTRRRVDVCRTDDTRPKVPTDDEPRTLTPADAEEREKRETGDGS